MKERFRTRWGFILAGLGMAIGTGNIWRFPRVVAQNGGGAFVIPWLASLFLWALPLVFLEYSLGRTHGKGVVGVFQDIYGRRKGWIGGFIAAVTAGIMFYYSVVTGWAMFYSLGSVLSKEIFSSPQNFWTRFQSSPLPLIFHLFSIFFVAYIVSRGVSKGIERATSLMVPSLFLLLVLLAVRVVFLPGGIKGLDFLFYPDFSKLAHARIWIEAASQAAWSTGAGWGLVLTYSIYARKTEDGFTNSAVLVFGDYTASLLAAIAVVGTIFSFTSSSGEALKILSSGNVGLTFLWIPRLFSRLPLPGLFSFLFFFSLFLAAASSLISLMELEVRVLGDMGIPRRKASLIVASVGFLLGLPSALSLNFLNNQDWVWGLALLLNGFIFSTVVWKKGRGFMEYVKRATRYPVFSYVLGVTKFLVPVEFLFLLSWWLGTSFRGKFWDPFSTYTPATVIFQWFVVFLILYVLFNYRRGGKFEA